MIAERLLWILALVGLVMIPFHNDGSSIIIFTLPSLGLFYLFGSYFILNSVKFKNLFKKRGYMHIKSLESFSSFALGLSFFFMLFAFILKMLSWTLGDEILTFFASFALLILFSLTIYRNKISKKFIRKSWYRFLLIGIYGLILHLV